MTMNGAFFAPSGKKLTDKMVALAIIKPGEKALDLGSGDGSTYSGQEFRQIRHFAF